MPMVACSVFRWWTPNDNTLKVLVDSDRAGCPEHEILNFRWSIEDWRKIIETLERDASNNITEFSRR